jgi:hypothetical protein
LWNIVKFIEKIQSQVPCGDDHFNDCPHPVLGSVLRNALMKGHSWRESNTSSPWDVLKVLDPRPIPFENNIPRRIANSRSSARYVDYKAILILFSVVFLLCAGCGGQGYNTSSSSGGAALQRAAMAREAAYFEADSVGAAPQLARAEMGYDESGGQETPLGAEIPEQSRKLIKRAELRLRVEDPAAIEAPLSNLMAKYDAWPAATGIYENSRNYSIRVPPSYYDTMLSELAGLGRILWRTENAEDVTLRYYDLEGRLATKRELLRTYQEYLGKALNISEIMTVESRIADLQQEIDWTGTQLRNLSNLIDYSTIDLEITGPPNISSYARPKLGEKVGELFSSFGSVASSALVVLMGIVIYGIPAILIIVLLFWLLFGRIGLLKKLWRLAAEKRGAEQSREN